MILLFISFLTGLCFSLFSTSLRSWSFSWVDMVVHVYNPSDSGGKGSRPAQAKVQYPM
jgi:hypothetical protein